jgi:hypothetical protein
MEAYTRITSSRGFVRLAAAAALAVLVSAVLLAAQPSEAAPPLPLEDQPGNILMNPGFEECCFYEKPPNHWIAAEWHRWWIHNEGDLAEYGDADEDRHPYEGNHMQVMQHYGYPYWGGIYQVISDVTPCVLYRFSMYAKNIMDSDFDSNAKIGIDPLGGPMGDKDGAVKDGLPEETVWSRSVEPSEYESWTQLEVETEAFSDTLLVLTHAHPEPYDDDYFDSWWDSGSVIRVPFPEGRLPVPESMTPTGFIYNVVSSRFPNTLTIQWETLEPASTQVWYNVTPPDAAGEVGEATEYAFATPLDATPVMTHQADIGGLAAGDLVQFVVLSRHTSDEACATDVDGPYEVVMPGSVRTFIPLVLK